MNRDVAYRFIDSLPSELKERPWDEATIEELADELQNLVGWVISSLINAGSERDVVCEDEALHSALIGVLRGWDDNAG